MKKQLKLTGLFVALALLLVSCRAGDCGCPMSMDASGIDEMDSRLSRSD